MTLTIQLTEELEAALKEQANARGVSPAGYVRDILERELGSSGVDKQAQLPFKTSFGVLAKHGAAPSAEEIDANRAEIFRHFAED